MKEYTRDLYTGFLLRSAKKSKFLKLTNVEVNFDMIDYRAAKDATDTICLYIDNAPNIQSVTFLMLVLV